MYSSEEGILSNITCTSLQSHAACDGCEAIEWRRQIAARILYS
jgi:hypothetical protein